jgi:predicted RNA-binding protein YlqC (UPF0109 family)
MGEPIPMRRAPKTRSLDEIATELEELVYSMARSLVDQPAEIIVTRAVNPSGFIAFEVTTAESDGGSLLGKRGSLADAQRTVLMAAAAARKVRVSVQYMSAARDSIGRH